MLALATPGSACGPLGRTSSCIETTRLCCCLPLEGVMDENVSPEPTSSPGRCLLPYPTGISTPPACPAVPNAPFGPVAPFAPVAPCSPGPKPCSSLLTVGLSGAPSPKGPGSVRLCLAKYAPHASPPGLLGLARLRTPSDLSAPAPALMACQQRDTHKFSGDYLLGSSATMRKT